MEGDVLDLWASATEPFETGVSSSSIFQSSTTSNKYSVQYTELSNLEVSAKVTGSMNGGFDDDDSDDDGLQLCKRVWQITTPENVDTHCQDAEFDYDELRPVVATAPEVEQLNSPGPEISKEERSDSCTSLEKLTDGETRQPALSPERGKPLTSSSKTIKTGSQSKLSKSIVTSSPSIMAPQSIPIPIQTRASKSPPPHPRVRGTSPSTVKEAKEVKRSSSTGSESNTRVVRKQSLSAFTPVSHLGDMSESNTNCQRRNSNEGSCKPLTRQSENSSSNSITPESESRESRSTGDSSLNIRKTNIRKSCVLTTPRSTRSTAPSIPLKAFEDVLADVAASLTLLHESLKNNSNPSIVRSSANYRSTSACRGVNTSVASHSSYSEAARRRSSSLQPRQSLQIQTPSRSLGRMNTSATRSSSACTRNTPDNSSLIGSLSRELQSTQSELLQLRADLSTTMKVLHDQSTQISRLRMKINNK